MRSFLWLAAPFVALAMAAICSCADPMAKPPREREIRHKYLAGVEQIPTRESEPTSVPEPELQCDGLLEPSSFGSAGHYLVRAHGRFAVGSRIGMSFDPVLYFNTRQQAVRCHGQLDVAEWVGDRWKILGMGRTNGTH